MPHFPDRTMHFSALRWFDLQTGPTRIVAVFFSPICPSEQQPASQADQDGACEQTRGLCKPAGSGNVVELGSHRAECVRRKKITHA